MAKNYTYDDFVNAAGNAGMLNAFSQEDLTISQRNPEYGLSLLKLQQDAGKATTSEQKLLAQEAVNQLRKTYSAMPTTTAASAEVPASSTSTPPAAADGTASSAVAGGGTGFTYAGESAYQKALDAVTGFKPYSYDHKTDSTYNQLGQAYLQDNQAMEDNILSNPAVGGDGTMPSYAGAAAGQSANYYAGKLNDIIPQLEQNAYEQYLKDLQIANGQLDAAAADKELNYNQWLQQQELEMAAAQQKYANDLLLHKTFGQAAPSLPDLTGVGTGSSAAGEGQGMVPDYSYGKQNSYQAALDAVLGNPQFQWTMTEDPSYGALRKSYMREGQRASEDALARASAGSMGIPSSYAIRQAADAGNAYNEQLMNGAMGLQENAYGRYLTDFNNRLSTLGQLGEDRQMDYNQWLQNYQLDQKVQQQNFDNAVQLYRATGQLTPQIAAALGIPYVAPAAAYSDSGFGPYDGGGGNTKRLEGILNQATAGYDPSIRPIIGDALVYDKTVNSVINAAVQSGEISKQQAAALKGTYGNSNLNKYKN